MANVRKHPPDKIVADCPHCGFSQLEPVATKYTRCRNPKCEKNYQIQKLLAKDFASIRQPSMLDRFGKWISREKSRHVTCFCCRENHEVSTTAESSLCPSCGSYIDIRDFRIEGPLSSSIRTQGQVYLSPTADVACHRILCGRVRIEGRSRGEIICTDEAAIRVAGEYEGDVRSEKVVIQSKANVTFVRDIYARSVEVEGRVRGTFMCEGRLTVRKKGVLEGTVHAQSVAVDKGGTIAGTIHARSIAVEKGGTFSGNLRIDQAVTVAFQGLETWTWFPSHQAGNEILAAEDFGDFPPSAEVPFAEDEEVLQQPQIELQIKRRPRK